MRALRSTTLAILVAVAGATACKTSSGGQLRSSDDASVEAAAEGAAEGEFCGGFAALKCATGLKCQSKNGGFGDAGGKCVKAPAGTTPGGANGSGTPTWGDEGGSCGGFAGFTCKAGLACLGAGPADKPGKCVKKQVGGAGAGGTTVGNGGNPGFGDEGGMCGGFAGLACKLGMKCIGAGPFDQAGKCKKVGGGTPTTTGGSSTAGGDAPTTPTWGDENGKCGGIAGLSCKAGLKCVGAGPADKPGKCLRKASFGGGGGSVEPGIAEGGSCGGFAGLACKSTLTCVGQGLADQPGTCKKLEANSWGEEGGFCGGFAGLACQEGLICKGQGFADQPGKCARLQVNEASWGESNGPCGGFGGVACQEGLQCIGAGGADQPGVCQAQGTHPEWGEAGGSCGGLAGIPCADGLNCTGAGGGDQPGTCQ